MPVKENREYRSFKLGADERADEEQKRTVTGYASTFDEPYELFSGDGWKYLETVDKTAFDNTDMSDVIMQYDHEGRVFARTKNGTLAVAPDDMGLFITADLGGTEIGRELYDEIRGGYTDKMSFGFTVTDDYEDREEVDGMVIYTRHIKSVGKLYDVSAVSIPANDATSISVRKLNDGVIERLKAERLEKEALELERMRAEVRARALLGGNK